MDTYGYLWIPMDTYGSTIDNHSGHAAFFHICDVPTVFTRKPSAFRIIPFTAA